MITFYFRKQLETKNKPQREVIQITTVVPSYKPVNNHVHNVSTVYTGQQSHVQCTSYPGKQIVWYL